ncbi:hypothetical protein PAHAL_2G017600 [Panicum hallii]|jgi:hypothetical protein|uniref:Uncharacterized protein n=1 Tax=Panicum hallii TaxID=206008 RepID=A0A2S3GVC5_9POAL|nr:hypothetical protein PAHAL_2G017600 [Panicum hallii]
MVPVDVRAEQAVPVARDGVPDEEVHGRVLQHVDEDAAVAAVGARVGEVGHQCGGGEARGGVPLDDLAPVEEAEEGRCSVEGAVPAAEGGGAEDAEPRLVDEGRAEEVLRLVGQEAPWCGRARRMRVGWGKGTTRVSETAAARVLDCYWVGLDHGHTYLCHAGWLSKNYLKMIGGCKILWRKNKNFWWWDCLIKGLFSSP